jgi:hypothetical protein
VKLDCLDTTYENISLVSSCPVTRDIKQLLQSDRGVNVATMTRLAIFVLVTFLVLEAFRLIRRSEDFLTWSGTVRPNSLISVIVSSSLLEGPGLCVGNASM